MEAEEGSDDNTGVVTLQTSGGSDNEETVEKQEPSGWSALFNPLLNTMSSPEPSSGPSKSYQTSKQPTVSPTPMPKFGVRSTLFNPLLNPISFSEPSSGPCKSYRTFKQPTIHPMPMPSSEPPKSRHILFDERTPSPSPAPKLPALSKKLEELGDRITSLEHNVRQAYIRQSEQTKYLELAVTELLGFIYEEQASLNDLGKAGKKAGMKNRHRNGKGKERVSDIAVAAVDEQEEL